MSEDVIVAERLLVRYRGKAALDGLDLRVPRGAVYAFLGDNGAGKTTTMKVLTGLAPPDSGRATILGLDCWSRAQQLRHRVGYMPERPRFYDWMTVAEIGWFASGFHPDCPGGSAGFQGRYAVLVRGFDLPADRKIKGLSKGMRAKVGLALAMAPMAASSSSPSNAAASSLISAAFSAFSAAGRLSVTMPTAPRRSTMILW